ncbi:MAG TPA: hypothetical protein VEF06_11120 [Bryobacteraceae bacterium]|nr:hypothetical protein [Bryobacteraceae bacterium]
MTTAELQQHLNSIEPGITQSGVKLFPCAAGLKDGRVLERLCIVSGDGYRCLTGKPYDPAERRGWNVEPSEIEQITASPHRLPANHASQIYAAGESGMGYYIFTVVFRPFRHRYYVRLACRFHRIPVGSAAVACR